MNPEVFGIMTLIGAVTFVLYLLISSRHKERLALLEFDRDASVFYRNPSGGNGALKFGLFLGFAGFGLLLGFAGFGILLGYLAHRLLGLPQEVATFSFLFMTAGAGLLTYYFLLQRRGDH